MKGKIKKIYIRVKTTTVRNIVTQSIFGTTTPNYKLIHHPLLPNYLKTFNHKLENNALPVQAKFKLNIPDLNPYCFLSKTTYENDIHLFSKCVEIKALLHYVTRIYYNITKQHSTYFHQTIRIKSQTPPQNIPYDEHITPYLNSIMSHTIWKTRNKNKKQSAPNIPAALIKSFKQSLKLRFKIYQTRDRKPYIKVLTQINNAIF